MYIKSSEGKSEIEQGFETLRSIGDPAQPLTAEEEMSADLEEGESCEDGEDMYKGEISDPSLFSGIPESQTTRVA
ncbi:UNVERIFIED_CONTAM: hypothetical protein FKN15_052320 [Acipenser sinensis]